MTRKHLVYAVFYALLFGFLAWLNLKLLGYADDDAYIHFRIAEHLLSFGQPYFNTGEPVMASSSSGWTLTLYLIFSIFGVNLKAVSVFNAAVSVLNVYVYGRLTAALTGRDGPANYLLAALAVVPVTVYSAAGLMETPLALLLLGLGMLLYANKKAFAFLFITACVFFRLELAVFLLLFTMHSLYRKAVPPWKTLGYVVIGAAPFVVYNLHFFGTNIPHTVEAKRLVYSLGPAWVLHFAVPSLLLPGDAGRLAELALILLLAALSAAALYRKHSNAGVVIALIASGLVVLASYFASGVMVFQWYTPLYQLPLFISFIMAARLRRSAVIWALAAVAFVPLASGFARTVYAASRDMHAYPYFQSGARTARYLDVGGRLYRKYPGCTLMSSEIGGLGYSFRGYIYDACGLASEGALKYQPMRVPEERRNGAVGAIPPGYVMEARPDIIVSYDSFDRALVRSGSLSDYVAIRQEVFTPHDMVLSDGSGLWGGRSLNVYIRRDKYSGAF